MHNSGSKPFIGGVPLKTSLSREKSSLVPPSPKMTQFCQNHIQGYFGTSTFIDIKGFRQHVVVTVLHVNLFLAGPSSETVTTKMAPPSSPATFK